nr:MAG TPA: hypothetical protein [Caudoviricetes sp.]
MWPFRKNKNKQKLRVLGDLSKSFAIVGELNRRGLIHWQVKDKILLIEESLATVELAQGETGFRRFLEHVVQWQNYQLIMEAYEQQRIDIESQAVRDADKKLGKILTPADIQRIRQQARNDMIMIDPHKLKNLIREFDIMIIRADAQSEEQATQENGQLLAIGHYDGEKLEMVMYDDVKAMLFQEK